jgi:hypothetical protein
VFDTIQPFFVVNVGDVTDHTDGFNYLTPDNTAEWVLYRNIIDARGMDETNWFDIPGNHDFYGNHGEFYLANAIQGVAQGTTQPQWILDLPFGKYHFVAMATPCNDGLPWFADNNTFTDDEVAEVEYNLLTNTDADLTIAFGHHDLEATGNAGAMRALMMDHGVAHYGHGHEHAVGVRLGDGILRSQCYTFGQGDSDNICLWAVDGNAVSQSVVDVASPWPAAIITAPVDARLSNGDDVTNPYAPAVPATCEAAPVRVMAFDVIDIDEIYFTVDSGGLHTLTENPAFPDQYLGSFDATEFSAGVHTLEVHVNGTAGWRQFDAQILIEDGECDLEPPVVVEPDPEPVAEVVEPIPEGETPEDVADATTDSVDDVTADTATDDDLDPVEHKDGKVTTNCGCSMVY